VGGGGESGPARFSGKPRVPISILRRLRDIGVQIAVDDFGTGYSPLAYLRKLPIDELKLDRSFVFPMADDARAAALVFSTITLAHSLGLRMVAEGVENHAALTELARHGCDQAQGYFLSRPIPGPRARALAGRAGRIAAAPAAVAPRLVFPAEQTVNRATAPMVLIIGVVAQ
jgi:EAL domain-containing protein (putative c-di-GMP-specific phosphodiesterase class I)